MTMYLVDYVFWEFTSTLQGDFKALIIVGDIYIIM